MPRKLSPAEQEVQDIISQAEQGLGGQNPRDVTLSRSSNPRAAWRGMRNMAEREQSNAYNQRQAGYEANRQERQRIADEKAAASAQEAAAKQAAKDRMAAEARNVRAAAASGAATQTDVKTGRTTIKRHPDGTAVSKVGEVGKPYIESVTTQESYIHNDPSAWDADGNLVKQPSTKAPVYKPLSNPMIPDDGGAASAPGTATKTESENWVQDRRDDKWNVTPTPITPKTDKQGNQTIELPDATGLDQKRRIAVDEKARRTAMRMQAADERAAQLDIAGKQVELNRSVVGAKFKPIQDDLKARQKEVDAYTKGEYAWTNPKTGTLYPVIDGKPDLRQPMSEAAKGLYLGNKRKAVEQLQRAQAEHDKIAPQVQRIQDEADRIAREKLINAEEKYRAANDIPNDAGFIARQVAAATGEVEIPAQRAAREIEDAAQPDTETPVEPTPATQDAFRSLSGLQGMKAKKDGAFTSLWRDGRWIASLENKDGQPFVTLRDFASGQDDVQAIVRNSTDGVPVYLRDNRERMNPAQEAEQAAEVFRTLEDPALDQAAKTKRLNELGVSPAEIRRKVSAGLMSVQTGKALSKGLWGDNLDAKPYDEEGFKRFLAANPESAKAFAKASSDKGIPGVALPGVNSTFSLDDQKQVRMDYAREWALTEGSKPGVSRQEILDNYRVAGQFKGGKVASGANAFKDLMLHDIIGSMTGMLAGGVADLSAAEVALFGNENAKRMLEENMYLRNRDTKDSSVAYGRALKAWGTKEGQARAQELQNALAVFRNAIDTEADSSEPDKARIEAAEQAVREAALAMHELSQDEEWPITADNLDPNKDAALGRAIADYQATGDPRSFALYSERLLMANGRRQRSVEMERKLAGTHGNKFLKSFGGAMSVGWQELGSELVADAAMLGTGLGSKLLQKGLTKIGAVGKAARVERMTTRIGKGLDAAWNAGMRKGTLQKPLGVLGKTQNAIVRGAQMGVGEGFEEVIVSPGDDNPTPLHDFVVGMLGGVTLAPAAAITYAIRRTREPVIPAKEARLNEDFARKYNAQNAGTPGFQEVTGEEIGTARSFLDPMADQQAKETVARAVEAHDDAWADTPADAAKRGQARQTAQDAVDSIAGRQEDAIGAAKEISGQEDPARKTFLSGIAKVAAGNDAALTPNERKAIQGNKTAEGADYFQTVDTPEGPREFLTPEARAELTNSAPAIARLASWRPVPAATPTQQSNVPQQQATPQQQAADPADVVGQVEPQAPQTQPGATGMGAETQGGGGAALDGAGSEAAPGTQPVGEQADPFEPTAEDADAIQREMEAEAVAQEVADRTGKQANTERAFQLLEEGKTPEEAADILHQETNRVATVQEAIAEGKPVPAAEMDASGIEIPSDYTKTGDTYHKKQEAKKRKEASKDSMGKAREVAGRLFAELGKQMPKVRERITLSEESPYGDNETGGLAAMLDGTLTIILPDVAGMIERKGAKVVYEELRNGIIRHEVVHSAQVDVARKKWESQGKPGSFAAFWKDYSAKLMEEFAKNPKVIEIAKQIYDGKRIGQDGASFWDNISDSAKVAEIVRMIVEARLDPDKHQEFSELYRQIIAKSSPTIIEFFREMVAAMREFAANLTGKISEEANQYIAEVEALYRELTEGATVAETETVQPEAKKPAKKAPKKNEKKAEVPQSTPVGMSPADVFWKVGEQGTSKGMLLFKRPNGEVYKMFDYRNTPEKWGEMDGKTVTIPGYDTSNRAGGFVLRKVDYDANKDNPENSPADTIYSAVDHTMRSMRLSATQLFDQKAEVIGENPAEPKAEADPLAALDAELEKAMEGLFASPSPDAYTKPIPADRFAVLLPIVQRYIEAGVSTPEQLAERLKTAAGGKLIPFSRSIWKLFEASGIELEAQPDWNAIYEPGGMNETAGNRSMPEGEGTAANNVETPAEAAAEVKGEMANPDNRRPAKEIKAEIIQRVEAEIEKLPKLNPDDYVNDVQQGIAQQQILQDRGEQTFAQISIPGDGNFKIRRTSKDLGEFLARVKRMPVTAANPGAPNAARRGESISAEDLRKMTPEALNDFVRRAVNGELTPAVVTKVAKVFAEKGRNFEKEVIELRNEIGVDENNRVVRETEPQATEQPAAPGPYKRGQTIRFTHPALGAEIGEGTVQDVNSKGQILAVIGRTRYPNAKPVNSDSEQGATQQQDQQRSQSDTRPQQSKQIQGETQYPESTGQESFPTQNTRQTGQVPSQNDGTNKPRNGTEATGAVQSSSGQSVTQAEAAAQITKEQAADILQESDALKDRPIRTYEQAVAANQIHMGTRIPEWSAFPFSGEVRDGQPVQDTTGLNGFSHAPTLFRSSMVPGQGNCEWCGHQPIKSGFHIKHDTKKWTMVVGSECIGHFSEMSGLKMAAEAREGMAQATLKAIDDARSQLLREFQESRQGGYGRTVSWWSNVSAQSLRVKLGDLVGNTRIDSGRAALSRWIGKNKEAADNLLAEFAELMSRPDSIERMVTRRRNLIKKLAGDIQRNSEKPADKQAPADEVKRWERLRDETIAEVDAIRGELKPSPAPTKQERSPITAEELRALYDSHGVEYRQRYDALVAEFGEATVTKAANQIMRDYDPTRRIIPLIQDLENNRRWMTDYPAEQPSPPPESGTPDNTKPERPGAQDSGAGITSQPSTPESGAAESTSVDTTATDVDAKGIQDFGEKIGGARKDLWGKFGTTIRTELPDDAADITLAKHFPVPNVEQLLKEGVPADDIIKVIAMRDEIPAKPRAKWKVKRWAEQVKVLRRGAQIVLDGIESEKNTEIMDRVSELLKARLAIYRAAGVENIAKLGSLKPAVIEYIGGGKAGSSYGNPMLSLSANNTRSYWDRDGLEIDIGLKNTFATPEGLQKKIDEAAAELAKRILAKQEKAADQPAKRKTSERNPYQLYRDRFTKDIFVGRKGANGVVRMREGIKEVAEGRTIIAEQREDMDKQWEAMKEPPMLRRAHNSPRQGPKRREGHVTPDVFGETFGFRGVEFGNWVEDEKRQGDLNEAYDALLDMAEALGLPPRSLSLDGSLGLAFGARGTGGKRPAAAHYEPGFVVINLTKKSGPGSLAHEWWHAFDNYMARVDKTGETTAKPLDRWATTFSGMPNHMRMEIFEKFAALRKAIKGSEFEERSKKEDDARSKPYYGTMIEMTARAFEAFMVEKLASMKIANDYLVNTYGGAPQYPTTAELEGPIGNAYRELMGSLQTKETDKGIMLFSSPTQDSVKVDFSPDSAAVSAAVKGGFFKDAPKAGRINALEAFRYLTAKRGKVGLTEAETATLAQAEAALAEKLAEDAGPMAASPSEGSNERLDGAGNNGRIDQNQPGGANIGDAASPSSGVTPEMDAEYLAAVEAGDLVRAAALVDSSLRRLVPNQQKKQVHVIATTDYKLTRHNVAIPHGDGFLYITSDATVRFAPNWQGKISRAIDELRWPFEPDVYLRVTNSKEDYEHLRAGTHRGSLNHGVQDWESPTEEGGLSVARDLEFPAKYAYFVKGTRSHEGTDGEPVLDLASVRPFGKLMTWEAAVRKLEQARANHSGPAFLGMPTITGITKVRSADPVARDASGNVIPLSQRFNPDSDSILYASPSTAKPLDPILAEIKRLVADPDIKADTYGKMHNMVADVRKRFDMGRLDPNASKSEKARYIQIRDVAVLEAIAKALPKELRGKLIGSFRRLEELKSAAGRERYLLKMLPKVEQALEKHTVSLLRKDIRKIIDKSKPKPNESRNRRGKIGAIGHAIVDQAIDAMTESADAASKIAADLRDKVELGHVPETERVYAFEELEEMEGKAIALELFADYENADSARLAKAKEFLEDVYSTSRAEWLAELKARKQVRESDIAALREAIKAPEFITEQMLKEARAKSEKVAPKVGNAILEWVSSAYQLFDRLKENTTDPKAIAWVDEQQKKLRDARGAYDDAVEGERVALEEAMERIFKTRTGWVGKFDLDPILHRLSERRDDHPITVLEGVSKEEIVVPLSVAESLYRREVSGYDYHGKRYEITEQDRPAFEEAWEKFLELPEKAQAKRKILQFTRVKSAGRRNPMGKISQLEGLKEWLAMRQADFFAKYEARGWDETTFEQLDKWLKPEVKQLGLWMVDRLRDQTAALDAKHRSEFGIGMQLVENYFPGLFEAAGNQDSSVDIDGPDVSVRAKTASGLKTRVAHRSRPRQMNAISVYLSNRAQIHFFMTHATPLRELLQVFRAKEASEAIRVKVGEGYARNLIREMKLIETNGVLNADGVLEAERLIRKATSGYALSILGLKLSTLAINTTAVFNTLLGVPANKLAKGFTPEYIGDVRRFFDSPAIKRRLEHGTSHEVRLAAQGGIGANRYAQGGRRLAQTSLQAINWWDTFSNGILGAAAYRAKLEEARAAGLSEKEAVKIAEDFIDELSTTVMQPNNLLSRSLGEARLTAQPFGQLMFLFATEMRKNFAIGLYAARKVATGKGAMSRGMAVQQLVTLGLFYSAFGYLIRSAYQAAFKAEDDEPEEFLSRFWRRMTDAKQWTYALSTEHLRGIPFIGEAGSRLAADIINQTPLEGEAVRVFDASPNPLNRGVKGLATLQGIFEDDSTPEEQAQAVIDAIQGGLGMFQETAVIAQLGNVAEDALGLLTSNGMEISRKERTKRLKARFGNFLSEWRDENGGVGDDPVLRFQRDEAVIGYIEKVSASLDPEDRKAFMEAIDNRINENVRMAVSE